MRPTLPVLLLSAALPACDGPPLMEDPVLPGSVIRGIVTAPDLPVDQPLGPTVVLLSDGDNPMPPEGIGLPGTFAGVPPTAWTTGPGVRSAPFALTSLDPARYAVNAILDMDRSFHPEVTALATPTCGDFVGWHREGFDTGPVAAIELGDAQRIDDIVVGPLRPITEPNAVFTIEGDRTFAPGAVWRIVAEGVTAEFGTPEEERLPDDPVVGIRKIVEAPSSGAPCRAGFRVLRRDRDGDGDVDSLPLLPLPILDDQWPIAIVEFLGTPVDSDGDAFPDAFVREDVPAGEDPPFIVAVATTAPIDGVLPDPNVPRDVDALDVTLTGIALAVGDDGSLTVLDVATLPAGAYGMRLVTEAGQLWAVPNELDARLAISRDLPSPGLTTPGLPSQGVWITKP